MGSKETNQALRSWINEQTGGLLQEQAEGLELSAETVLALATTVYLPGQMGLRILPFRHRTPVSFTGCPRISPVTL